MLGFKEQIGNSYVMFLQSGCFWINCRPPSEFASCSERMLWDFFGTSRCFACLMSNVSCWDQRYFDTYFHIEYSAGPFERDRHRSIRLHRLWRIQSVTGRDLNLLHHSASWACRVVMISWRSLHVKELPQLHALDSSGKTFASLFDSPFFIVKVGLVVTICMVPARVTHCFAGMHSKSGVRWH